MHLEEDAMGRLIDGELGPAAEGGVREHLAGCPACRERVAEAVRDRDLVEALLRRLDHPPPPVEAGAVAARARGSMARRRVMQWAAGILLAVAAAGAAYAMPGSPLRNWMDSLVERQAPPSERPAGPSSPAPERQTPVSGVGLDPGRAFAIVFARRSGEPVRIALTEGEQLVVRAQGGTATFRTGVDRLLVDNAGGSASFEIEVPRRAPRIEVLVGSERLFLKEGSRLRPAPMAGAPDTIVVSLGPPGSSD